MKPKTYAERLAKLMGWSLKRATNELHDCARDGMSPQYIVQCAENGLEIL